MPAQVAPFCHDALVIELVSEHHPRASVVIPAHNEERSIGRLLRALAPAHRENRFEVIVVCNGCTDLTADMARAFGVEVMDLKEAGKVNALAEGDRCATGRVRVYVDADIEISANGVEALISAVEAGQVQAAGPRRIIPRDGVARMVAWYYDVWEALPSVREGLFGRGVIALSESGARRVRALPLAMNDDLAVSVAFESSERVVVDSASVVVHPPRTVRDLVRRRTRVVTGNVEADGSSLRGPETRTGARTLGQVVRRNPRLAGKVAVFLAVSAIAGARASRAVKAGDFTTWERDESSRTPIDNAGHCAVERRTHP
jgi:glycosyltransferase involved in cell wall biosynthesis